jgi:hypothetical protein
MSTENGNLEIVLERLGALAGEWRGRGEGRYPTIEPFVYEERIRFEFDASYPMLHYTQRTVLMPDHVPSHWECGFIRPLDTGMIEVSNAQDSGRVEVLSGALDLEKEGVDLRLESCLLGHDSRLVETGRHWRVIGDHFEYVKSMATGTTPTPHLQPHLRASLHRHA